MQELLDFYSKYKEKQNAYRLALNTMSYDQETVAPIQGHRYANKMMALLDSEAFNHANSEEALTKIEELYNVSEGDEVLKKELEYLLTKLHEEKDIPAELFKEYSLASREGISAWVKAKEESDFSSFKPYLKKIVELQKEVLRYHPNKNSSIYDILLDKYQKGLNQETLDIFFNELKKELVPLINKLKNRELNNQNKISETFEVEVQKQFIEDILTYFQVDKTRCMIAESEHPFSSFLSLNDVRMTTHYHEDDLFSSIFSVIHEYGHALYGLQINPDFEGSTLESEIGYAAHESQSRLLENHVGRSTAFWQANFKKLQNYFPSLKEVTLDDFMKLVNVSRPSLIRIEADELTYPLHILIRYEIEKEIFTNSNFDFDELPKLWNSKYEEYLGVCPENDSEGILQDIHWAGGSFGYFPTYALGSAYAAQLFHQMSKDIDVNSALKEEKFDLVSNWLKENIHQYGAFYTMEEIVLKVTKEPFSAKYYVDYLKDKFQ